MKVNIFSPCLIEKATHKIFLTEILASLQLYILSRDYNLPPRLKNKQFIKNVVTKFLRIDINDLRSRQRTLLYNEICYKLRQFKEIPKPRGANNSVNFLKAYLLSSICIFVPDIS